MRALVVWFLAAVCGVLFFYSRDLSWVGSEVRGVLEGLWYQKVISVSGLKTIEEFEILERLPAERSVSWWNRNLDAVSSELRKDSRIKSVSVSRCQERAVALYCFEVKVEEREPKFVASFGGKSWIVGDDGGFIAPLKDGEDSLRLPMVNGLRGNVQMAQALSSRIAAALEDISKIVGHEIKLLTVDDNGDLRCEFTTLPFSAVFSFSGFDEMTVSDQARRLVALLHAKQSQLDAISEVDLAFDKIAVVKYHKPEGTAAKKSAKASRPKR